MDIKDVVRSLAQQRCLLGGLRAREKYSDCCLFKRAELKGSQHRESRGPLNANYGRQRSSHLQSPPGHPGMNFQLLAERLTESTHPCSSVTLLPTRPRVRLVMLKRTAYMDFSVQEQGRATVLILKTKDMLGLFRNFHVDPVCRSQCTYCNLSSTVSL